MTERGQIDDAASDDAASDSARATQLGRLSLGDPARPNALLVTLVSRVSTGDRNALESTIP